MEINQNDFGKSIKKSKRSREDLIKDPDFKKFQSYLEREFKSLLIDAVKKARRDGLSSKDAMSAISLTTMDMTVASLKFSSLLDDMPPDLRRLLDLLDG